MTNQTWIEPPPPQKGLGCFAKGCLILLAFFVLLCVAFVAGTYLAVHYFRSEYSSTTRALLPTPAPQTESPQEVRARWDAFERAARAHQAAQIELTADDVNTLIASQPALRGKAHVSIEGNTAHLRVSVPLDDFVWLRGHYLNAECAVQSAPNGDPTEARVTQIRVNGQPVGEEVLRWQYRAWSLRGYMSDWSRHNNVDRFEIGDGHLVLQTKGE